MPIIMDGQTPQGRFLECRKTNDGTGPCKVRKMTAEERERYGLPNGPEQWEKPPSFACIAETLPGKNGRKKKDPEFGAKVREARLERGMSLEDLGKLVGCHRNTIRNVENGAFGLKYSMRMKICEVFGWEVE